MSDHHEAPSNPYLKKRRDSKETEKLTKRVQKIEQLLIDKGVVTREALDRIVEIYETDIGPMNGSKVVAKAMLIFANSHVDQTVFESDEIVDLTQ